MERFRLATGVAALVLFTAAVDAAHASASPDIDETSITQLHAHLNALTSAAFQGRQAGTQGGQDSARYIAQQYQKFGLVPAGDHRVSGNPQPWFQQRALVATHIQPPATFEMVVKPGDHSAISFHAEPGTNFLPVLDSPSVNALAPVVFVGYGLHDPARGVDDYRGVSVANRIVMFLRGKPATYPTWVTHEEKERTARAHGAVGFITVTPPILSAYEARRGMDTAPRAIYSQPPGEQPLPGVWIHGQTAVETFDRLGLPLRELQSRLNQHAPSLSQPLDLVARMTWTSAKQRGRLWNVLGVVPGGDVTRRHETILIAAHRDHFGSQAGLFFPGADDNASGTAILLAVARMLAQADPPPRRTVLFASFSGEEQGLLGSKHYVAHPSRPLDSTVAMMNIDHAGAGNGDITVGVTRIARTFVHDTADAADLAARTKLYGYFPGGDHVPFFKAGVPTITVVSSGAHPFYHQPTDSVATVQPDVLRRIARLTLALAWNLANTPENLRR